MTKKYTQLLFDLDKTILDFDRNSESTIYEIYTLLCLKAKGISDFEKFHRIYEFHNLKLWKLYLNDEIEKHELMVRRFADTLSEFEIDEPETAQSFSTKYLEILPTRTGVFPGTHETLKYLSGKYNLHIITNGFSEVQYTKLKNAEMEKFFTHVITSEEAGAKKPDKAIFNYTIQLIGARVEECLMIGDDIDVDMLGAKQAGIDQVYFNPKKSTHNEELTFEISEMGELVELL
jgi:putative hydrolase of the HAD superfamily